MRGEYAPSANSKCEQASFLVRTQLGPCQSLTWACGRARKLRATLRRAGARTSRTIGWPWRQARPTNWAADIPVLGDEPKHAKALYADLTDFVCFEIDV